MPKSRNAPYAPRFRLTNSMPVQIANAPYMAITPNGMGIFCLSLAELRSCQLTGKNRIPLRSRRLE
jgi:hypothetical protein